MRSERKTLHRTTGSFDILTDRFGSHVTNRTEKITGKGPAITRTGLAGEDMNQGIQGRFRGRVILYLSGSVLLFSMSEPLNLAAGFPCVLSEVS